MYPYLDIGFPLSTYALANVVAYLVGVSVAIRVGRSLGLPSKRIVDLTFWVLMAAIAGSRIAYLVEQLPLYLGVCLDESTTLRPPECDDLFRPWRGGFVFYGGLVGGVLALALLGRHYRLPLRTAADAIVPGLAVGHALGRIGCLLAGCCFGEVCFAPWAVRFPDESMPGPLPRHPTQLYEAGAEGLVLLLLLWRARRRRYDGHVFLTWMVAYPAARFVIELFRGDRLRGYVVEVTWPALNEALGLPWEATPLLSWAQAVSLGLVALGVVLMWLARRSS